MTLGNPKTIEVKPRNSSLDNPTLQEHKDNRIAEKAKDEPADSSFLQPANTTEAVTNTHIETPYESPAPDFRRNLTLREYRNGENERVATVETIPDTTSVNLTTEPFKETRTHRIDTANIEKYVQKLQMEQSLFIGFFGGLAAAIISAIIWAAITLATEIQIGYMSVGVGFLVGFAVRTLGKGFEKRFGYLGAALSLFGCILGNFFAIVVVIAQMQSASLLETLLFFITAPMAIIDAFKLTFQPIDLLFYGIAIYEGYRFSFKQITHQEVAGLS
jgi:hypothetical protein